MIITFTIYGNPIAKGRPKFTTIGGYARAYTPQKTKIHEESVLVQALPHKPPEPLSGAIKLVMRFYMPIPTSMSKKKRVLIAEGKLFPTKRPDVDNLCKVKDSLNKIMWTDDSIIVDERLSKFYSDNPRTEIVIEEIDSEKA